ncbi:MAG TPA: hypothetical protein PKM23_14360, partial [bacterium]|nr:hypothetical protein [bacterium]
AGSRIPAVHPEASFAPRFLFIFPHHPLPSLVTPTFLSTPSPQGETFKQHCPRGFVHPAPSLQKKIFTKQLLKKG